MRTIRIIYFSFLHFICLVLLAGYIAAFHGYNLTLPAQEPIAATYSKADRDALAALAGE